MSHHINLVRIKAVANLLSELKQDIVFIGGATTSLYADDRTTEPRPTDDVDVVIEIASYREYTELDEKLRVAGFVNDITSGVICRYQVKGITIDILPTEKGVLGFNNRWYPSGFREAITVHIDEAAVKIFSLPYFIASKFDAFDSRGKGDYRFSTDFEDIVYVLENNVNAEILLKVSPIELQDFFKVRFDRLLSDKNFEEGIISHLKPNDARYQFERIRKIFSDFTGLRGAIKLVEKNKNVRKRRS